MYYNREKRDRFKKRASELRRKTTGPEHFLKYWLRKSGERKILKQVVIGGCIVDLGLPYRNLLIEVDGFSHLEKEEKDLKRELWLKGLGFNFIRLKNEDVYKDLDYILKQVKELISESEINKQKFYCSKRAGNKQTYWEI